MLVLTIENQTGASIAIQIMRSSLRKQYPQHRKQLNSYEAWNKTNNFSGRGELGPIL